MAIGRNKEALASPSVVIKLGGTRYIIAAQLKRQQLKGDAASWATLSRLTRCLLMSQIGVGASKLKKAVAKNNRCGRAAAEPFINKAAEPKGHELVDGPQNLERVIDLNDMPKKNPRGARAIVRPKRLSSICACVARRH